MEPQEFLRQIQSIRAFRNLDASKKLKSEELVNNQAVNLGYDANLGVYLIRLGDGSLKYVRSITKGAVGLGTEVLLNQSANSLNQIEGRVRSRKFQQPYIPPLAYPFKVLFSVVEDGMQKFYIGGDRATPKSVKELHENALTSAHLQNTGKTDSAWAIAMNYNTDATPSYNYEYITGESSWNFATDLSMGFYYQGLGYWASPQVVPQSTIGGGNETYTQEGDEQSGSTRTRINNVTYALDPLYFPGSSSQYFSASGSGRFYRQDYFRDTSIPRTTHSRIAISNSYNIDLGTAAFSISNNSLSFASGTSTEVYSNTSNSENRTNEDAATSSSSGSETLNRDINISNPLFMRGNADLSYNSFSTESLTGSSAFTQAGGSGSSQESSDDSLDFEICILSGTNIDLTSYRKVSSTHPISRRTNASGGTYTDSYSSNLSFTYDGKMYAYINGTKKEVNSDPFFAVPVPHSVSITEQTDSITLQVNLRVGIELLARRVNTGTNNSDSGLDLPFKDLTGLPVIYTQKKEDSDSYYQVKGTISSVIKEDGSDFEDYSSDVGTTILGKTTDISSFSISVSKVETIGYDSFMSKAEASDFPGTLRSDNNSIFALIGQNLGSTYLDLFKYSTSNTSPYRYSFSTASYSFSLDPTMNFVGNKVYVSQVPKELKNKNGRCYVETWEFVEGSSGKLDVVKIKTESFGFYSLKNENCDIFSVSYFPQK